MKKRYERINLLRGISHDLKIPLSVIKLNTQMLDFYDLNEEEHTGCTRACLKAVSDLEQMISMM